MASADPDSSPPLAADVPGASRRAGILKRPCPSCGQRSLRRMGSGRTPGDRTGATPPEERPRARYTPMCCTAAGCGYEGWIARRKRRRLPAGLHRRQAALLAALRPWLRGTAALGLAGLVAGVGAAVGSAWERSTAPTAAEQRRSLPPGEYHDGDPLPAEHPLRSAGPAAAAVVQADGAAPVAAAATATAAASLDLRASCVWGRPGRQPYQGTVAEMLSAAQVPADVQAELLAQVAAGRKAGRVTIANDGIHDPASGRRFDARAFAMTYGRTLCLETRVNFPAGHREGADLFEARDRSGRLWSMMIPDVCGNVSLIGEKRRSASGELAFEAPGAGLPAQLTIGSRESIGASGASRSVPEPGTWALVAAALAALRLARARSRTCR